MSLISRTTKPVLDKPRTFSILLRLDPSTTHFVNNLRRSYPGDMIIPWTHVLLIERLPLWAVHPASKILGELTHNGIQPFEITLERPFINTRTLNGVGFGITSNQLHVLHSKIFKRLPAVVDQIRQMNAQYGNPSRRDMRIYYRPRVMIQQKFGIEETEKT